MSLYYWSGTFVSWTTVKPPNHIRQILFIMKISF